MRKQYKLLDRNLIRNFGNVVVELDSGIGDRFVKEGKAIDTSKSSVPRKSLHFPPMHKAIFHPPEEKAFEDIGDDRNVKFPGPNDKLFPHIEK